MPLKYMHKLLYKNYMRQHHFRDELATYRPRYQIIDDIENLMLCLSAGNNILKHPVGNRSRYKSSNILLFFLPQEVANNVPRF